jgi:hypothetical protein
LVTTDGDLGFNLMDTKPQPIHGATEAIKALHDSRTMAYVICSGAGAGLTELLWSVPGCSRTLIASEFPYHPRAFADLIGRAPEQYSSIDAAIALAAAGYLKAQQILAEAGELVTPIASLGLTAAVSTDRLRRGEDSVYIAIRTTDRLATVAARFPRGQMSRRDEGQLCDLLGLNCLLWAAGLDQVPVPQLPVESNELRGNRLLSPSLVALDFAAASLPALVDANGRVKTLEAISPEEHVIFPGSFNPLHFGHDLCAQAVSLISGKQVVFEIAAANADKSAIAYEVLSERALQFRGRWPVLVSEGLPLFIDKARAYGGFSFVLGLDTAVRLFEVRYFKGESERDAIAEELRALGVRFYVCDRGDDPLALPALLADVRFEGLFVPVQVRFPISSSEIRAAFTEGAYGAG